MKTRTQNIHSPVANRSFPPRIVWLQAAMRGSWFFALGSVSGREPRPLIAARVEPRLRGALAQAHLPGQMAAISAKHRRVCWPLNEVLPLENAEIMHSYTSLRRCQRMPWRKNPAVVEWLG